MNFDAINNKIISIDTIIKIAEYLEGEKEHYGKLSGYLPENSIHPKSLTCI